MKPIFKKTLLAVIITLTSNGSFAGTLTSAGTVFGQEFIRAHVATTTQNIPDLTYTFAVDIPQNTILTFTFPDGVLPEGFTVPTPITTGTLTVSTLNSMVNSFSYSVTVTGSTTDTITIPTSPLLSNSALATLNDNNGINVSFSAVTDRGVGANIDTIETIDIVTVEDEIGALAITTASALDTQIGVIAEKKVFTTGATDILGFEVPINTNINVGVTLDKLVLVLFGNFSGFEEAAFYLTQKNDVTLSSSVITGVYDNKNKTVTFIVNTTEISDLFTNGTANTIEGEIKMIPSIGNNKIIRDNQNFSLNGTISFNGTNNEALGLVNAEKWPINSAVINIPYLPLGKNISHVLYVTNKSNFDGDITIEGSDEEGNTYDLGTIGTATAETVTKITDQVIQGFAAVGFESGETTLTITVNAPKENITVYAAYKVGDDRAFVNTSQYKGQ